MGRQAAVEGNAAVAFEHRLSGYGMLSRSHAGVIDERGDLEMALTDPLNGTLEDHNLLSAPGEGGPTNGVVSWVRRHNKVLTVVAASVAPLLYLVYVDRYAVDSFNTDDWSVVPLVHAALHGHLTLSQLWAQKTESRLFMGNLVDVLFGFIDRLDLRAVDFFSAALLTASYAAMLALLRKYLGRSLTPLPVLVVGVTWFSLADVQNALWAFQVSWYLTVFFFVVMLVPLLVPNAHRALWFGAAALLAVATSLSTVQGFACWPVGAICILWSRPFARRQRTEIAVWLGARCSPSPSFFPGTNSGRGIHA